MSGRTFAAMAEAAKNDPTIAVRVSHYLYRCPEELFDYERDPDALNNLIDDLKAKPNLKASRSILLEHMKKTDDPEFKDYSVYLKSVRPVIDAIQDDWAKFKTALQVLLGKALTAIGTLNSGHTRYPVRWPKTQHESLQFLFVNFLRSSKLDYLN